MVRRFSFIIKSIQLLGFLIPFGYVFFLGCAGSGPPSPLPGQDRRAPREPIVVNPPGIDSTIAKNAFMESRDIFISIEDETLSQQKKEEGKRESDIFLALEKLTSLDDSLRNETSLMEQIQALEVDPNKKRSLRSRVLAQGTNGALGQIDIENRERLLRIKQLYEEAHSLNPFDIILMVDLAFIYRRMGQRSEGRKEGEPDYSSKAIAMLNQAISLDRSNHRIYSRLGEYYFDLENWTGACENFTKALDMMRAFAFLPEDLQVESYEGFVDSSLAFRYLTGIIQSHMKLRNSEDALQTIDEAEAFARSPLHREALKEYRMLINWAKGNIRARELFVDAEELRTGKNYLGATEKYHDVLQQTRGTAEKAYLETAYILSLMEYQELLGNREYLKRHRPETIGMNRLRVVIKAIPKDMYGVPLDSIYNDYFDNYGRMLFNEGTEAVKAKNHRQALALFQQGAILHSRVQARCCLELIKLTMHRGSVGLRWALKTYVLRDRLPREERIQLYQLMRFVTKRSNNPILCKYFNEEYRSYMTDSPPVPDRKTQIMVYEFLRSGYGSLDRYFMEKFGIRQNPIHRQEVEQKYRDAEKSLPVRRREVLRNEITEVYRKMVDPELSSDWQEYLQRLRQGD